MELRARRDSAEDLWECFLTHDARTFNRKLRDFGPYTSIPGLLTRPVCFRGQDALVLMYGSTERVPSDVTTSPAIFT